MFTAMGLSAVVPVLHGLKLYGYKQLEDQIGLSWLVLQGVLYIAGALIYAVSHPCPVYSNQSLTMIQARIPEKYSPGTYDIWGSSHQIFHVLVVMAAAAHLAGLLKAYDHEHSHRAAIMSSYGKLRQLVPPSWSDIW